MTGAVAEKPATGRALRGKAQDGAAGTAAPRASRRPGRIWIWYLIAGLGAIVIFQLLPTGVPRDVPYVLIGLSSGVAILVGVRVHQPTLRAPWILMAAAQLTWSCADAALSWHLDVRGLDTFPSIADPIYLLGYPTAFAGLWLLSRGRGLRDVGGLLDSATVTAGLGVLSWVLLAGPTLNTYSESALAATVALAYPIADIFLVGFLIRLLTLPGGRTPSFWLLLGGVSALIAVDSLATALSLLTSGDTASIDFLWLASYILWGTSALHPSMTRVTAPPDVQRPGFSRIRLVALAVAVLIAPGTLAVEQLAGLPLSVWAVVTGSVVMFSLVVARMWLALWHMAKAMREREEMQDYLAHQATHDSLTGLPNRAQAMGLITAALSRARRSGQIVGLLFVDLDGFKTINDTLGHGAGDEVLKAAADRMKSAVRAGDVVARLGGDEFVVLLEPIDADASALGVADRLVEAVSQPIRLDSGRLVRVGASIGVAISQDANIDPEALLHEADIAVYRAKGAGKGRAEVYDSSLRQEVQSRAEIETSLAEAIRNDELSLVYQHIVSLQFGGVESCEAFVRWVRPGQGVLRPDDFLPIAERSDLICELDAWVLQHALAQLAEWRATDHSLDLSMSVNVSGRSLSRERILDDVRTALDASGLTPQQLIIEVPEKAITDDPVLLSNLDQLRWLGVRIAVDDFGSGFSSISRLEHLPVDIVKIDKRFLGSTEASADKLLRVIIQAAHAFGRPVVAEGVELMEQFDVLLSVGCESAQGYFFGRPVSADKINLSLGQLTRGA